MEIRVAVNWAGSDDAQAMAELKYDNLMFRVGTGELLLSPDEIEQEKVTQSSVADLANVLSNTNHEDYYLVARNEEGVPVGYCRMTWRLEVQQFQFQQFYVRPDLLGKKIGGRIMNTALLVAQDGRYSATGVFLFTGDYNKKAQAMYEHWGFKHAGPNESTFEQHGERTVEWVKMVFVF